MKAVLLLGSIVCQGSALSVHKNNGLHQLNDAPVAAAKEADTTVVKPFEFDQRLLICNAYPSKSSITVTKNAHEKLADSSHAIGFKECRYVGGKVQPRDKLDLLLQDLDVHGTFEVGDLPSSDAVLLLVLDKHKGSTLVGFQSFAFPTSGNSKEAQLAVIDAFQGNSSMAHLKMEDHVDKKEKRQVSRRVEQLNFNKVYAIEEGVYDTSVSEGFSEEAGKEVEQRTKHTIKLEKNKNYVVLRTGDDSVGEAQSVVIFPEAEFKSAGHRAGAAAVVAAAFFVSLFFA